jgi:MFS family permease
MYSESDLEAAVAAGALSPEAARQLRDFIAARNALPAADEEHFRLLTGFNDIFVGLATIILLVAVAWIANVIPPRIDGDGPSPFAGFFVAAVSWSLAEFFTRKRRMALPSIILLLAFVGGVFACAGVTIGVGLGEEAYRDSEATAALTLAVAAAIAAGGAYIHWRRFRVPITVAVGAAAGAALLLAVVASALVDVTAAQDILLGVALILGLAVFAIAMWWDASDPKRETRRSDVAFWLHLLAAPMIVHPIFSLLGLTEGGAGTAEAAVVILLYVVLGLAAIAVDRRALLVSALAYVLYALNSLFQASGAMELSLALTALVIGSALLMLSAFWVQTRRVVLGPLPAHLRARLAPIDRAAAPAAA